jgi:isopentenyl diphosphate isomerase/L-lactate dehydrogenase-like FMN-dependent dehydrogenase
LQIMSRELQVSMALAGCNDIRAVSRAMLHRRELVGLG